MSGQKKHKEPGELRNTAYRLCLAVILFLLIAIRLVDVFIYPDTQLVPPDFFFALAIIQIFLLWLDEIREKSFILWAQKKKDELAEMKSKFTMITSHELMTPIAVIKGYLALFTDGMMGPVGNDQKKALDTITRHMTRLEQLKTALMSLYADSKGVIGKDAKPSSVQELIKATAGDAMPFIRKRSLSLALEIEESLPLVTIDAAEIRHVLMSLILNSIRFTPDGGRIVVRARDAGKDVLVEVEDNGIGIPKDRLKTIFEGFYEAGDTEQHHSGTIEFKSGGMGLGLAIAKAVINGYRGRIWAESQPDKSTKVIFTLPKN